MTAVNFLNQITADGTSGASAVIASRCYTIVCLDQGATIQFEGGAFSTGAFFALADLQQVNGAPEGTQAWRLIDTPITSIRGTVSNYVDGAISAWIIPS